VHTLCFSIVTKVEQSRSHIESLSIVFSYLSRELLTP